MHRLSSEILDSTIGNIKYRNNVVTGEIATVNGNNTYDVYISGSDVAYPNIPTTVKEPDFEVGEAVEILIEYGNKEMPIIIGHAKKVAQEFVEDEINVLVTTLDAYSITTTTAYLEGRVEEIEGYENVTRRGFYYGTSTDYGNDTYSTGSFVAGSYSKQITGLDANTTYHYQAYVYDAYNDVHTGDDKTMTTSIILNLISVNSGAGANVISVHSGITSNVGSSFNSPGIEPSGLAFDGTNLISCDSVDDKIYIHDGVSSGITSSFPSPNYAITGLTYDGTNLISCDDWTGNKIYIHDGVSSGITSSFTGPGNSHPSGLTYANGNLISCDHGTNLIYIHNGISSGVLSSFASPSTKITGLAFDGTNLISCDQDEDKIYIHSGISSGVLSSFASPSTTPWGLTCQK